MEFQRNEIQELLDEGNYIFSSKNEYKYVGKLMQYIYSGSQLSWKNLKLCQNRGGNIILLLFFYV